MSGVTDGTVANTASCRAIESGSSELCLHLDRLGIGVDDTTWRSMTGDSRCHLENGYRLDMRITMSSADGAPRRHVGMGRH